MMMNPLYVAIDTVDVAKARALVAGLRDLVGGIKLGLEFFVANGPQGVEAVAAGVPLFLDLKFHDIPNTVAGAMAAVAPLAPRLTTIHASGGREMMKMAVDTVREAAAKAGHPPPKVLAISVLTSLDQQGVEAVGIRGSILEQVERLARLGLEAGIDGMVCSPHEVRALREATDGKMTLVVPGIRPAWAEVGDQKRVMTPKEALEQGADILVIGRPITGADNPVLAATRIAQEIGF